MLDYLWSIIFFGLVIGNILYFKHISKKRKKRESVPISDIKDINNLILEDEKNCAIYEKSFVDKLEKKILKYEKQGILLEEDKKVIKNEKNQIECENNILEEKNNTLKHDNGSLKLEKNKIERVVLEAKQKIKCLRLSMEQMMQEKEREKVFFAQQYDEILEKNNLLKRDVEKFIRIEKEYIEVIDKVDKIELEKQKESEHSFSLEERLIEKDRVANFLKIELDKLENIDKKYKEIKNKVNQRQVENNMLKQENIQFKTMISDLEEKFRDIPIKEIKLENNMLLNQIEKDRKTINYLKKQIFYKDKEVKIDSDNIKKQDFFEIDKMDKISIENIALKKICEDLKEKVSTL